MQDYLSQIYQQLIQTSFLEWIATISGFICVYLASKQNIWNWPISIISVLSYLYIFFQNKLYGDALLQIYFLSTAIYGWYYWNKRAQSSEKPITSLTTKELLYTLFVISVLTFVFAYLLNRYTDSDVPFADGFCTSVSLVAQFLMTRKILQNWLLWLFVDLCYIPLYLHKGLILTTLLYVTFAIIAFYGFRDWRKTYQNFH